MGSEEAIPGAAGPSKGLYLQLLTGFAIGVVLFAANLFVTYVVFAEMFVGDLEGDAAFFMLLVIVASAAGLLKLVRAWCRTSGWELSWGTVAVLSPAWLSPSLFLSLLLILDG